MDGTYPLPEAQLDRFLLKLQVSYPSFNDLSDIVDRTTQGEAQTAEPVATATDVLAAQRLIRDVPLATHVKNYAIRLVMATHPQTPRTTGRGAQLRALRLQPARRAEPVLAAKVRALFAGRFNVSFDDLREVAVPCLRHRLILNFEGEAEGIDTAEIVSGLVRDLPESGP